MKTTALAKIAPNLSPGYRHDHVRAVIAGATDTETLHAARNELGHWADGLTGKNRLNKRHSSRPATYSPTRSALIADAQAAYDEIAAELVERGAL